MEWIIRAESLTKRFDSRKKEPVTALDAITLKIPSGQLTALAGPDGAGKTTLMRLICGLMLPTEGRLFVDGIDVAKNPQAVQERISYMPQKFGLYEDLSIQENLELYAKLHGVPQEVRKERFAHLLAMTGLSDFTERLAGKLSGGMKQKLGLACTLVRSPRLLLLDEPTVGVDPLSRRELWEILGRLTREEKLSVLVSTAYMDEAEKCREVYILNHGRFLAEGSPEALRSQVSGRCFEVTPPSDMPTRLLGAKLLQAPQVVDAVPFAGRVHLQVWKAEEMPPVLHDLGIMPQCVVPTFEDFFMYALNKDEREESEASENQDVFSPVLKSKDIEAQVIDIEVKNLVRRFGDFTAVSHTSFAVQRGEVFGLLGPNGAGKTTTFRMLCGLLRATEGSLQVAGVDMRKEPQRARAKLGYVAQKFSLYENLTVEENLSFFGGAYGLVGRRLKERMRIVMKEFQLTEKRNVTAGSLPGGYKQRLSMAVALIHEPQILFLDEPTSGIDPLARRRFWEQITKLSAKGTTIIITTHFMDEAEYCDRMMIQDKGKLLILGSPSEVRRRTGLMNQSMDSVFVSIVEDSRRRKDEKVEG